MTITREPNNTEAVIAIVAGAVASTQARPYQGDLREVQPDWDIEVAKTFVDVAEQIVFESMSRGYED